MMKNIEPIELRNEDLTKALFDKVSFLSVAEGGAMGEPGAVVFFAENGALYHFNTLFGDVGFEKFAKLFPMITKCEFGMFGIGSRVPDGWVYVNLGMGNHLIVRDNVYSEFEARIGEFDDPARIYGVWIETASKVLDEKNNGRRYVSREDRVEVFQDTLNWIKTDSDLSRAVAKAKKKTEVIYEDDYPAFDANRLKDEQISVTKERSFQAAMRLASMNPEAKIAVMNFANAFHAGGGVTRGASAQEECLCRCSTLYPLLYRRTLRDSFYKHHHELNTSKASDSLIYIEGVIICKTDEDYPERMEKEDWVNVDVITIAAPDLRTKSNMYAQIVGSGTYMNDAELFGYHVKRAMHMLTVAACKGADMLVLGAFGCGAFQNDPEVVAKAYKTALEIFPKVFDKVVFAVYCSPRDKKNYEAFRDILQ